MWTTLSRYLQNLPLRAGLKLQTLGQQWGERLRREDRAAATGPNAEYSVLKKFVGGLLAGLLSVAWPVSLQAQERYGGEFGGGGRDYWGGMFSSEPQQRMCAAMEIFQMLAIFTCLVAMFYWGFMAARGQKDKWKLSMLAFFTMAFISGPFEWFELLGMDVLVNLTRGAWQCLELGSGML